MTLTHKSSYVWLTCMVTGKFEFMSIDADEDEHSIEMQLPYIAKVMEPARGNFTIVPVMVGSLSPSSEAKYGKIFAKYLKVLIIICFIFYMNMLIISLLQDPSVCFVISSDFCHWGDRFHYTHYDSTQGEIHQSIKVKRISSIVVYDKVNIL